MPSEPGPQTGISPPREELATTAGQRLPVPIGAPGRPPPPPPSRQPLSRRLWAWRWRLALLLLLLALAGRAATPWLLGPVVAPLPVVRGALVQSVVAAGRVETPHRVNIGSQITGTVVEVPVQQGQAVAAGQLLVVLEDREAQAAAEQAAGAVAQAEARLRQIIEVTLPVAQESLRQAEANFLNAQQQYSRAERLRAGGFETQVQLDNARRTLDVAEAQLRAARFQEAANSPGGTEQVLATTALRQAQAALQVALSRLDYTRIRAPEAGTLIGRNVERGWVVQPNQVLMVLSPTGETQIVVQIDERNLGRIALGQRALVSADAFPDRRFEAELTYVNPSVDAQRAAVEVKLRVPAPPEYLRQDMTVSVDIAVAERADALILPASAVHGATGPEPWVLKLENGRARRQPVRLGLRGAQQVEVLEGLREGEMVLPAAAPVRDGSRVRARHAS